MCLCQGLVMHLGRLNPWLERRIHRCRLSRVMDMGQLHHLTMGIWASIRKLSSRGLEFEFAHTGGLADTPTGSSSTRASNEGRLLPQPRGSFRVT